MYDSYRRYDDYEDYEDYYGSSSSFTFRKKGVDEKLIKKYIEGFEDMKDDLIEKAKFIIKKQWNFSEKIIQETIENCLESFKGGLGYAYNNFKTDEEVISYYYDIINYYCRNKDEDIKFTLLNL